MPRVQADPPSAPRAKAPADERLLVVTVNYRTPERVLLLLDSLEPERERVPGLEVVVVDNASGDGSPERLAAAVQAAGRSAWVRILPSPTNGGFAAGNNLALREALAEPSPPPFFCLQNPDTTVYPGALRVLLDFLMAHPEVGIAGPATELGRGNLLGSAFRFPGILNAFEQGTHLGIVTRLLAPWALVHPPASEPHPTEWISGGCMAVRREVFEAAGLFDEDYFLYYEEVDFLRAARRAGWPTWYVPASRIVHDAGASSKVTGGNELERRMPLYWFESRRRYFLKNHGRAYKLAVDLAWLAGNAVFQLRRRLRATPAQEPRGFFLDFLRFNLFGRRWSA